MGGGLDPRFPAADDPPPFSRKSTGVSMLPLPWFVRGGLLVLVAVSALATNPASARAQDATPPLVLPASASVPTTPAAAPLGPAVRFEQQETHVGDRAVQRLGLHLALTTKIVQSGQVAHESSADLRRQQQRTIDVLAVAEGRAVNAKATFDLSRRQSPDQPALAELKPLPIEGKSYLMSRDGDKLTVTDLEGRIPPLDEYKLVAESLESVGQPNPLAVVLAGRELRVGQRVFVPRDMAQALLGFGSPELARIHRFELTLNRLAPLVEGAEPVAIFGARKTPTTTQST
jgi:hypothetical protein